MIVFNPLASSSEPAGTDQIWKMQELYLKSVMLYIFFANMQLEPHFQAGE